jgi:hypothetical protein
MFNWLKDHFIPHKGNNHRPHFLRKRTIIEAVAVIAVLELALVILPAFKGINLGLKGSPAEVLSPVLTNLTNTERSAALVPTLRENSLLDKAATLKAQDMAAKSYFAHTSPEGLTPWYWFDEVGYKYDYAGENLAVDFTDSADVTKAWMNSPTHRANIVKQAYTEVGTGVAKGTYNGHDTIFVVQLYGRPATVLNPVVPENVVPKPTVARVQGAETAGTPAPKVAEAAPLQPAETSNVTTPTETRVEKLVTAPRHTVNYFLLGLLTLVVLALVLDVLLKPHIEHPDLITNGLALMTLLLAVYVFNNYIITRAVIPNEAAAIVSQLQ